MNSKIEAIVRGAKNDDRITEDEEQTIINFLSLFELEDTSLAELLHDKAHNSVHKAVPERNRAVLEIVSDEAEEIIQRVAAEIIEEVNVRFKSDEEISELAKVKLNQQTRDE